jgi:hypothetical protein
MPVGDAVQKFPTLEQEMAEFKGFSTVDGEISKEKLSAEEKAGAETRERVATAAAAAAAAGRRQEVGRSWARKRSSKDGED